MHKLYIGTVETFAENVNINQYLNVAMTEVFYKLFPYFCRRLLSMAVAVIPLCP